MPSSLSRFVAKTAGFVEDFAHTARLKFSLSERLKLVRARLSRNERTRVLNFKVRRIGRDSFRIVLREVFFRGEYDFDPGIECPAILDCGANIGMATLYFKHRFPDASIQAFEADPETAAVLRENVTSNGLRNVQVHNLMLTDREGEFSFYPGGEASLLGSAKASRISTGRAIKVKGSRLSQFVTGPVDLLKLDVEGSEFEVMNDLITSSKIDLIQRMIIEYHHKIGGADSRFAEFLHMLEENGFEYQISATGCDPITSQGVYQDILVGAYRQRANGGAIPERKES